MKIGFDNQKYLSMQSEHIRERINQFDNKLYLEFGGKLFDDYHASRVLPGFAPDSKLQMLMQLSDQAEIVVVISAGDIEKNKVRGDLGITYDLDVLRLIEAFRGKGLYVGSVAITQYTGQKSADAFKKKLENLDIPVYILYSIDGYPNNVSLYKIFLHMVPRFYFCSSINCWMTSKASLFSSHKFRYFFKIRIARCSSSSR